MNIIDIIKEKQSIYNFTFYGVGDYATGFDVEELINNYVKIKEYFDNKNGKIKSYDDFIDYLFLRKYSLFTDVKQYIKDEAKQNFEIAYKYIDDKIKQYSNNELLNYLKDNAIDIINTKNNHIINILFDLVFQFHTPCKDIILHIAKTKNYLIISNFNDVKNVLIKYNDVCLEILKPKYFEQSKRFMLKQYFGLVKYFLKIKTYQKNANVLVDAIIKYGNEVLKQMNSDNALELEFIYKNICGFLNEINHKSYVEFNKSSNFVEEQLQEYLQKHGHEHSFEIPSEKLFAPFKDEKISLQMKILLLTHLKEKNEVKSYFTILGQDTTKSITEDLYTTTTPHDEYFTITKQQIMNLYDYVYLTCLQFFVNKNKINEFISILAELTKEVCKEHKLDFEELELSTDFNILLNMFYDLFMAYEAKNEFLITGLQYSISMFEMALIEKLLRNLYIVKSSNDYIKSDWSSMGKLLNTNNETMVKLLGLHNIRIMSYYLIHNENDIGLNYRNNYAHYKNIKIKDIDYTKVLKITQILLCIINELIIRIK